MESKSVASPPSGSAGSVAGCCGAGSASEVATVTGGTLLSPVVAIGCTGGVEFSSSLLPFICFAASMHFSAKSSSFSVLSSHQISLEDRLTEMGSIIVSIPIADIFASYKMECIF